MADFKLTSQANSIEPPEIMCSDTFIDQTSEQIDALLPDDLKVVGAILYSESFSLFKIKTFSGTWEVIGE